MGQGFPRPSEYKDKLNSVSDFTKTKNIREETCKMVVFTIAATLTHQHFPEHWTCDNAFDRGWRGWQAKLVETAPALLDNSGSASCL